MPFLEASCWSATDITFHERSELDRFAAGTPPTLIRNVTIWTGAYNGTQVIYGDIFCWRGMILKVGRINSTLLQTYGNEPVVLVARGWWVTPGIVDPHSHMGDSPSLNLSGSDDGNSFKGIAQPWLRSLDGPDIVDYSGGQAYVIKLRKTAKHSTDDSGTTVSNSSSNFVFSRSVFASSSAAHQTGTYSTGSRCTSQHLEYLRSLTTIKPKEWDAGEISLYTRALDVSIRSTYATHFRPILSDLVVWDSHPLAIGATPVQVFMDGIAQLEDPVVIEKPDKSQDAPKIPNYDEEAREAVECDRRNSAEVGSADAITTLISLKQELEAVNENKIHLTIFGATESHLLAKELAEAGVGVVVGPVHPIPDSWEIRRK
ncbi:hypothetical protein HHX47_DHR6000507 [Lentinula edodes]|nr:hypothetical protein HHX47_DHR6000507 [Lentinula edodes]